MKTSAVISEAAPWPPAARHDTKTNPKPPRMMVVIFALLLGTAVGHRAFALDPQATPPAASRNVALESTQATIVPGEHDDFVHDQDSFSCWNFGQVMIARQRIFGGYSKGTSYWCGKVMINGAQAKAEDQLNSSTFNDDSGWYYAPANRVITYGEYDDDDWQRAQHGSSVVVTQAREILNVRPEGAWRHVGDKYDKMECPPNMALVARSHAEDFVCATLWTGNPPPSTKSGVITLRHWESSQPCSLLVPNGPNKEVRYYMLMGSDSPCANDVNASIEFEEVPSATTVLLTDGAICEKDGTYNDFWIELRTTVKETTAEKINLDEFFGFSPGAIVLPGVKLVAYHRKAGASASKRLSCVQITTSAAPPAPQRLEPTR